MGSTVKEAFRLILREMRLQQALGIGEVLSVGTREDVIEQIPPALKARILARAEKLGIERWQIADRFREWLSRIIASGAFRSAVETGRDHFGRREANLG